MLKSTTCSPQYRTTVIGFLLQRLSRWMYVSAISPSKLIPLHHHYLLHLYCPGARRTASRSRRPRRSFMMSALTCFMERLRLLSEVVGVVKQLRSTLLLNGLLEEG